MTFRGFFVRSTPKPLVVIPQPEPDYDAGIAAFESMPRWMTR